MFNVCESLHDERGYSEFAAGVRGVPLAITMKYADFSPGYMAAVVQLTPLSFDEVVKRDT